MNKNSIGFRIRSLVTVLALSFVALSASAKGVLYVKSGASGDGSSWNNAMGNIQQAVDSAAKIGADVWVATGVYKSESSAVVSLKPNVSLYGGFAGTESSLATRDTAKNPTVLDGGGMVRVINQGNAFTAASAVEVNGFTIQNGSAQNGGGVNLLAYTTINNCILKGNKASSYGSAIYAKNATIKNSQIINNAYLSYLHYTVRLDNCVMDSCVVKNNKSYYYSAVCAENNSKVTNCEIAGNSSSYSNSYRGSYFNSAIVSNCKFVNTTAGGASVELQGSTVMTDCLFEGNKNINTNLIYVGSRNVLVENCRILDNTTNSTLLNFAGRFNRCTIQGNTSSSRIAEVGSYSSILNCLICDNVCTSSTEPFYLNDNALMSNCTVVRNETKHGYILSMRNSTLNNSIVVGNKRSANYTGILGLNGTNRISHNMLEYNSVNGNIDGSMKYAAFTDAENGDYSLSEKSYCINAGVDVTDSLDLLGKTRKQGGAVDMGAIESSHSHAPAIRLGEVVYVKPGAEGDGTSWQSAFGDIQQAIVAASTDG